jgi:aldoxime dehydratase
LKPALESGVAPHLRRARTNPAQMRSADYVPEFESFTGRLAEKITALTIAYFGVQSVDSDAARSAAHELDHLVDVDGGPVHHDRARFTDQLGYSTYIVICYWDDQSRFDAWYEDHGCEWTSTDHSTAGLGFFTEIVRPSVDRLETIFTSQTRREGLATLANSMEPFVEHGYWGSMRDRLPITQVDPVKGEGRPRAAENGGLRVVVPQGNMCLIRSGQDYRETTGAERTFFLEDIEPSLRAGMDFLRDDGLAVGCFSNRYMDVIDDEDRFVEKRFAMSWWNDLADLETWSKSHPTHARIFDSAMRHITEFGAEADLHLYHEVVVADRAQQLFEYLDCHDLTGLLPGTRAS